MVARWNGWTVLQEEEKQLQQNRQRLWQEGANTQDETWTPLSEWMLKGVKKYRDPLKDRDLLMYVQQEEDAPPPKETFYTNQQALDEIHAVLSRHGLTHQRLDDMLQEYRQAMEQGMISAGEWEKCAAELEQIRTHHAQRLDELVTWFMENYYRVLEEKVQVVTKIKLTGTRVWSNSREQEFKEILALPYQPPQRRPMR